jgi:DNA-directed RNA polymerase specialized sigma24 family protein
MSDVDPTGTARPPLATPDAGELVELVSGWSEYVRARVHPSDVDDVLQTVRETVLGRAETYDARRGEPGAWVFGVVRVCVKAARRVHAVACEREAAAALDENLPAAAAVYGDPLAYVVEYCDALEWAHLVAEAATPFEWQVIVTFAETEGSAVDVAASLRVPITTVRSARDRVAVLTQTARTALDARDFGVPITLHGCVPSAGGFAALLPYRDADEVHAAAALGIAVSTFRKRRALVTRLQQLVDEIASTSSPRPPHL